MSERRRPGNPRTEMDGGDPILEQRVRAWLHAEDDQPPESLATASIERVRQTSQRPAWRARLGARRDARAPRALQLGGAVASIVVAVVVVSLAWQAVMGPAQQTANPATSAAIEASPSPAASQTGPTGTAVTPFDGRAVAMLQLEHGATALGSGFDSLWLGDSGGRLLRIDPADMHVIATLELGGIPCGPIIAAAESIWLTTCGSGVSTEAAVTLRVDPSTNLVTDRYEDAGGDGVGAAAMNGLVWFISDVQEGRLTAVDAASGEHVRDLAIGMPLRHLTAGFGSLWVSPIGRPVVLRLDPGSGAQQAEIALSGDSGYLATAGDAIWVAEPHQWLVGRIDPVTDRLSAELGASPGVDHLVVEPTGVVWSLSDAEAMAVDPALNRTVDRFGVPVHLAFDAIGTHVLTVLDATVWFADGTTLLRIDPA